VITAASGVIMATVVLILYFIFIIRNRTVRTAKKRENTEET